MHFHGSMAAEKRRAAARRRLLHRVEERPRPGDRVNAQRIGQLAEMAAQHGVVDVELARRLRHDLMERPRLLLAPIDFADRVAERMDFAAQRLALGLGDVELADAGEQQVADLVHRVRDRRVRADQRAFHAAGAEIGDELRHVAPEEALVLQGGASGRHEEACARHHRRLGDGALPERGGHDVFEIAGVEEARARVGSLDAAHPGRNQHGAPGRPRGGGFSLLESRNVVVDPLRRLEPVADHRHVAFDDGLALGAELLRNLLADLLQHRLFRGAGGDAVDMSAHRADEGDAHHADFKLRRRRVLLRHCEAVEHVELDLPVADGLARRGGSSFQTSAGESCDWRMNVPPSTSPRSGLLWLNTLWSGETTISTSSSSALVISTGSGLRVM